MGLEVRREVSRRRYSVLVKLLKDVIGTDQIGKERITVVQRMRAAEMLMMIYGDYLPSFGSDKRNNKLIRELVEERVFERGIKEGLRKAVGTLSPSEGQEGQDEQDGAAASQEQEQEPSLDEQAVNNPALAEALAHYRAITGQEERA